ncbi:hypothetical protein TNCV_3013591 [Trichonephila clavipes]|nr:hypothetical protein TNCV_3013591 [Trichonephila clavipes]
MSIPDPPELTTSQIPDPPAPIPPELTTPQSLLPDPTPELTTPHILLPDPPVQTRHLRFFYQIHLCRQHLRFFYQIHHLSRQPLRSFYQIHLWSSLWSRPLRMTLPWIKSCRPYLETTCNKGFPRLIPKNLTCLTRCLPCLTRVVWKNGDCVYESFGSDLGQRGRVEILSSGSSSLSPSLGGVSTSHYGCVYFGFYRQPSSRRRVREMVDVVGRLGNASRRQPSLAHRGSPTLEAGFGKTRAVLA